MFIFEKTLPHVEGMVEVLDENGDSTYTITPEQVKKESEGKQIQTLQEENATLKIQLAQSDDAALSLFEAQAATDEAILAIYEKIGGATA